MKVRVNITWNFDSTKILGIKRWNVTCAHSNARSACWRITLFAFSNTRHAICSLFCDSRSDVNRGSIQLFSSTGASKPILSLQEGKTRPVARLLIHSWSRHAASSRSSLPYPIIYGAQCRLIMARADMSLIRPGQTYARYSNIKPRTRTPFFVSTLVFRPVNKEKKKKKKRAAGGSSIRWTPTTWVDEPSLGNVLPFFRPVVMISPPLCRLLLLPSIVSPERD